MQLDDTRIPHEITSNDLFYSYPSYDAIDFEIQCILKLLEKYKELFADDNKNSEYGVKAIEKKEEKILKIMLLNKVVHYIETLGAVSLAILATKSERSHERYDKNVEKEKFISRLTKYEVGDVVNFYRDISKRPSSYLFRLAGYPPSLFQSQEISSFLEGSSRNISDLLHNMEGYYRDYTRIYNAYKHGYRIVIPDTVNRREGIIVKEGGNAPFVGYFENNEVEKLKQIATNCRALLEMIYENNKRLCMLKAGRR